MKKIVAIAMVLFFVGSMFPLTVFGASPEPSFIVDFSTNRKIDVEAMSSGDYGACVTEYTNDDVKVTAASNNANWFLGYYCNFDADANQYIKLRIKNECPGDTFEVFASTEETGNYPIRLDLWECKPNTSEYKEYVYKIAENIGNGSWTGNIKRIRLDFVVGPNPNKDDVIYLDYFAVFKTQADADAFNIDTWEAANAPGKIAASTNPAPASNGYPSAIFDFKAKNKADIEAKVATAPGDCTVEYLDDALLATATKDTANWRYGLNADVHAAVAQYVKVRLKNETSGPKLELWLHQRPGSETMTTGVQMPISTKDTEYKEYIFKISDNLVSGLYVNRLGTLRIDFSETPRPANGEKFYIDYIAFFATKAEAEYFDITGYRAGTWKPVATTTTSPGGATTTPPTFDAFTINMFVFVPAALVLAYAANVKRRKTSK